MFLRRQDFSVVLLYLLGFSKIRNWILRLRREAVTVFVYFHDLPPETIGCFKANMRFLKHCTNVVSMDDFFSGRLSCNKINVVITFDDGYKSWATYAVPILKEFGLPATFFVSSGFVGLSSEGQSEFLRSNLCLNLPPRSPVGGLGEEEVGRFVEEGFTVGGHSVNHYNLAELGDHALVRCEVVKDKASLEKMIETKIEYFAYPFGAYQNPTIDIEEVLKEAGYRGAVTTMSGFNTADTSRYRLHREITSASMHPWVFRARVYGNYHAVRFLKQLLSRSQ